MGVATDFILNHISKLEEGEIFPTRVMLGYGKRSAVDQALRRLVNDGFLARLARGLFMKNSLALGRDTPLPSLAEIVRAKAAAFKKQVLTAGRELAQSMGVDQPPVSSVEYAVNGWSSSFMTCHGRVVLRQVAQRNLHLGESLVGKCLRGFWKIGELKLTERITYAMTIRFGRQDREEMRSRTDMLPQWLSEFLELPRSDDGKLTSVTGKPIRRDSEYDPANGFWVRAADGQWVFTKKRRPKKH